MFGLGAWEIVLIFLLVLFFFGAKRIPAIARGVGGAIRDFRSSVREEGRLEDGTRSPDRDEEEPRS